MSDETKPLNPKDYPKKSGEKDVEIRLVRGVEVPYNTAMGGPVSPPTTEKQAAKVMEDSVKAEIDFVQQQADTNAKNAAKAAKEAAKPDPTV